MIILSGIRALTAASLHELGVNALTTEINFPQFDIIDVEVIRLEVPLRQL